HDRADAVEKEDETGAVGREPAVVRQVQDQERKNHRAGPVDELRGRDGPYRTRQVPQVLPILQHGLGGLYGKRGSGVLRDASEAWGTGGGGARALTEIGGRRGGWGGTGEDGARPRNHPGIPGGAGQRSASIAALQPSPAADTAWRYVGSATSPAAK